jgi:nitrate/TMAO reductase-like tetraheme cytochrome c subunit
MSAVWIAIRISRGFPHPQVVASSPRDFSLQLYPTCQQCHTEQYAKTLDSVHQRAFAAGNKNAAVCTDCHNPHEQQRLTDKTTGELSESARVVIPQTCAQCHSTIYETYRQSVHGSALTEEANQDVPTCIDCHGVHNIGDPTSNSFRNSTPSLCAKCHTDETLMQKYSLSTNVLNTYVADFHGTTVKMFEESFPSTHEQTRHTDCHGFLIFGERILRRALYISKTSRQVSACHPDATRILHQFVDEPLRTQSLYSRSFSSSICSTKSLFPLFWEA